MIFAQSTYTATYSAVMRAIPFRKYVEVNLGQSQFSSVNDPPSFICNASSNYSQSACFKACNDASSSTRCTCQRFGLHALNKRIPVCSPWDIVHYCPFAASGEKCRNMCPAGCTVNKYEVHTTSMDFDKKVLTKLLGGNRSTENLEWFVENHSVIHVAYTQFEITEITQYFALSAGTLLCNFGGLFGLFLGGSVLTVVHALMFIIGQVVGRVCGKKNIHKSSSDTDEGNV